MKFIFKRGTNKWAGQQKAVYSPNDRLADLVGMAGDITFRRMIEEEYGFISAVLDTVGVLLVVLDKHGRIVRFNGTCEKTTGYSFKEVKGSFFWDLLLFPEEVDLVKDKFKQLTAQCLPGEYEINWLARDGSPRLIKWSITAITDQNGAVVHFIGTGIDITGRKRTLVNLRKYNNQVKNLVIERARKLMKYNQLLRVETSRRKHAQKALARQCQIIKLYFDHTHAPLALLDRDFNFIRVNRAYASTDNRDPSEFPGRNHFDLYPSDARKIFEDVVETKTPFQAYAMPFAYKNNPERGVTYWDWTLVPVLDSSGEVEMLILSLNDVTQRIQTEEELRKALTESRQRSKEIEALLRSSRAIVEHHQFKDAVRIIFDSCRDLIGATAGYVCLKNERNEHEAVLLDPGKYYCTVDPSLSMPIRGLREKAYKTCRVVYENDFPGNRRASFLPEGHLKLENVLFAPLVFRGKAWGLIALGNKPGGFTDNDARLAAAFCKDAAVSLYNSLLLKTLRHSRSRFKSVARTATDAIITIDAGGKIIFWNKAAETIFGYTAGEALGNNITLIMPEHSRKQFQEKISRDFTTEKPFILRKTLEMAALKKDGSEFPVEISISNWTSMGEIYFTGIVRDISERKQAEEALRLSEERFARAFNASPNPMAICSFEDWLYLDVNASFLGVTGFRRDEVIGRSAAELNICVDPEFPARIKSLVATHEKVSNLDVSLRTKSGELREGLFSAEIINLRDGQYILAVFNDLTERKQLERELAHLDRLNLVGQMAAGIGHEIRNPMTTVRGFLQMLGRRDDYQKDREYFQIMIEELDRANSIITEFLSIAKNKPEDLRTQNLNSIIRTMSPLISADAMNDNKDVIIELGEIPNLRLNEKEIRQLILNLVRNGLEAMESGGILSVKTFMEGNEVVLSVQDQGNGMDSSIHDKIGTPFFTTKEDGTGLGLAVCYGIAARHKATINFKTGSMGTTFFVRFKQ